MKKLLILAILVSSLFSANKGNKIPIKTVENECYIIVPIGFKNPSFVEARKDIVFDYSRVNQKIKEGYIIQSAPNLNFKKDSSGDLESAYQSMIFPKCFKSRK